MPFNSERNPDYMENCLIPAMGQRKYKINLWYHKVRKNSKCDGNLLKGYMSKLEVVPQRLNFGQLEQHNK